MDGCGDDRDRTDQPPGLAYDRLPRPAQQGDRRAQCLRPRGGHPPGWRPEGAHHIRDHGRDHRRPALELDRPRQALGAPCPQQSARGDGLRDRRAGSQRRLQALQGDRRPQEAGHGHGPGGTRHGRAARGHRRVRPGVVRGRVLLAALASRQGRRDAPRRQLGDGQLRRRRSHRRDLPGHQRRHGDLTGAQRVHHRSGHRGAGRLGEVSVVVELDGSTGAGQSVSTDIIDAAARAYVRALSVALSGRRQATRSACQRPPRDWAGGV